MFPVPRLIKSEFQDYLSLNFAWAVGKSIAMLNHVQNLHILHQVLHLVFGFLAGFPADTLIRLLLLLLPPSEISRGVRSPSTSLPRSLEVFVVQGVFTLTTSTRSISSKAVAMFGL